MPRNGGPRDSVADENDEGVCLQIRPRCPGSGDEVPVAAENQRTEGER